MTELKIPISDDLEEKMKKHPEINWASIINHVIEQYFNNLDFQEKPITTKEIEKLTEYSLKEFLEKEPDLYNISTSEVKIHKSKEFSLYVNSNELILKFSELLEDFLTSYFKSSMYTPISYELLMFVFPGENYKEPMIRIVYPDSNDFNNLKIRDIIEEKFKLFLVNKSKDLEEYKAFRQVQKKFCFTIQRE